MESEGNSSYHSVLWVDWLVVLSAVRRNEQIRERLEIREAVRLMIGCDEMRM